VNPGVVIGIVIVVLALAGGGIMVASSNKGGGKGGSSGAKADYDRGYKLYQAGKFDEAITVLQGIPSSASQYENARNIIKDIELRRRQERDLKQQEAARGVWEGLKAQVKRFDDGMTTREEDAALKEAMKGFLSSYPAANEAGKAREIFVKLGGDPAEVGTTEPPDESKLAEGGWADLQPRVKMHEGGDLPQEEQDRLKRDLRAFITRFSRYPEAAEAQRVLRGMGGGGGDPVEPPPTGDPKNFKELTALVDGVAAGNNWAEALRLLEDWIKKDPTGPDATPTEDKIREVKKAADNWYLGREAEAESLAQAQKYKDAKEILEDAVRRLGEKSFFEQTAAAKKKIAGLEKAMGDK
jgi:tetratricopeptide (TPR) repeat protein